MGTAFRVDDYTRLTATYAFVHSFARSPGDIAYLLACFFTQKERKERRKESHISSLHACTSNIHLSERVHLISSNLELAKLSHTELS